MTLLGPQSRFGDKALKFQVICPQLSPQRDCSPKRFKGGISLLTNNCSYFPFYLLEGFSCGDYYCRTKGRLGPICRNIHKESLSSGPTIVLGGACPPARPTTCPGRRCLSTLHPCLPAIRNIFRKVLRSSLSCRACDSPSRYCGGPY